MNDDHYPPEYLIAAHEHVTHNREEILRSATCTCFYCGYRFDPRSGEESLIWTDTDPDKHSHTPDLGRHVFDSQSAESRTLTIEEKLSRIREAVEAGHSVLELISVYLKRFGRRTDLRTQALVDLFALAAVAPMATLGR